MRILLHDVPPDAAAPIVDTLRQGGEPIDFVHAASLDEARELIAGRCCDLVLSRLPELSVEARHLAAAAQASPDDPPVVFCAPAVKPGEADANGTSALVAASGAWLHEILMRRFRAPRESELRGRVRQQELVANLGLRALVEHDLSGLFRGAMDAIVESLDVEFAAMFELVPGTGQVRLTAGTGWRDGLVGHYTLPGGSRTFAAHGLRQRAPLVVEDVKASPDFAASTLLLEHGIVSGMAVVVHGPTDPLGLLCAFASRRRAFSHDDVHVLQAVANILAGAIGRSAAEEGLLRSQQRLQSVQKMEAIGRLAGGIAHDFNNLVQAIAGYSELLVNHLPKEDPLYRHAVGIQKAGERAGALTRQLLAFSRQQVLQPTVLDLNAVVANVEQLLRRLIGEDIELRTSPGANLGHVKADAAQLEQVLMNLAVNARDAMPNGGLLTIETANVTLGPADQRDAFAVVPGPYAMLSVTDTGTGMDPETRARAFEPFFTTKPAGKGTGLGLSTVYGIVKQSGGYIWVDSEVNRGTRVRIYLPRVDEDLPPETGKPPLVTATGGSETLLLVEDEEGVRDLIREWLADQGYTVLTASNGTEALALSDEYPGRIDLLIADVIMPHMGGPALARRLTALRPDIKVIYVSGYADEAIGDPRLLETGAAFLQKPFTLDALLRTVNEVLARPDRPESDR